MNHKVLSAVSMCLRSDASHLKRIASWALNALVVVFLIALGVLPSNAYMYTHADNMQICLFTTHQVVAFISCTVVYFTFTMHKTVVHGMHVDCSQAENQGIRLPNDSRYEQAERKRHYGALFPPVLSVAGSARNNLSGFVNGRLEPRS